MSKNGNTEFTMSISDEELSTRVANLCKLLPNRVHMWFKTDLTEEQSAVVSRQFLKVEDHGMSFVGFPTKQSEQLDFTVHYDDNVFIAKKERKITIYRDHTAFVTLFVKNGDSWQIQNIWKENGKDLIPELQRDIFKAVYGDDWYKYITLNYCEGNSLSARASSINFMTKL